MSQRPLALAASAGLACLLAAAPAPARSLFEASISVGGSPAQTRGVDRLGDLNDLYSQANLAALFPSYTPSSAVSADLDLRGLPAHFSYAAGSNSLQLDIPGVLSVRFDGTDRQESEQLLEDWFEGKFSSATAPAIALQDLALALIKHSPVDPVAGNPNSLQTRMFDADYRLGGEGPFVSGARLPDGPDLSSLGLRAALTDSGPFQVLRGELPLSYRVNFREPSMSLLFDLPLTLTSTQGQLSGLGSIGAGVQIRPVSWWSLTPMARVGAVGSEGLGALAILYSGSVTSHLHLPLPVGGLELGIANMLGLSRSYNGLEVNGLELDYDLQNFSIRNGLSLTAPVGLELLGERMGFELYGSDQRFFGDDLFLEAQADVGASLLMLREIGGKDYSALRLGVSYVFGDSVDEVGLELQLRF